MLSYPRRCLLAVVVPALCLLASEATGAATIYVPEDYSTVAEGLEASANGDTVIIGAGIWRETDLYLPQGVSVRGATGDPRDVILDGGFQGTNPVMWASSAYDFPAGPVDVRGLTFRRGQGGFSTWNTTAVVSDCRFETCVSHNWSGLDLRSNGYGQHTSQVVNCTFVECEANSGGALSNNTALTLNNCRFVRNRASTGGAVFSTNATVSVWGCTFVKNTSYLPGGAFVSNTGSQVTVTRSTFSGNTVTRPGELGSAIWLSGYDWSNFTLRQCVVVGGNAPPVAKRYSAPGLTVECSDVFGNEGGDWAGLMAPFEGVSGNVSVDPLFCRPGAADVSIDVASPCSPDNSACGQIGSGDPQCALTVPRARQSLQLESWGSIKATYR